MKGNYITAVTPPTGGRCYWTLSPMQETLPLTVMGLYINLLAINHSKVTSDIRRFWSIFAILAKALFNADFYYEVRHQSLFKRFESMERLFKATSPVIRKTEYKPKFILCHFQHCRLLYNDCLTS